MLEEETSLFDLSYFPIPLDEGYDIALCLDSQFAVLWDEDDSLAHEHSGCIDDYANEGIQEPVVSVKITSATKVIDFAAIDKKLDWLGRLDHFFERAYEYIRKYPDQ